MVDCPDGGCVTVKVLAREVEDAVDGLNDCTNKIHEAHSTLVMAVERMTNINNKLSDGADRFDRLEERINAVKEDVAVLKSHEPCESPSMAKTTSIASAVASAIATGAVIAYEAIKAMSK